MGFWSALGKGLLGAGGAIAAPFTGGASLIPTILSTAGSVASAASQGRAQGRAQEAGINANQDAMKLRAAQMMEDALQGRAGLDLQQKQFALNAPQARARNSVKGDLLANGQDVSIDAGPRIKIPTITGGLRPSMFSDNSRQLGQQMSRDALLGQMQGDQFEKLPAPNIPSITPTPQSGKLDTILNALGMAGAGAGVMNEAGLFGGKGPLANASKPNVGGTGLTVGNPSLPTFAGWAAPGTPKTPDIPLNANWWEDMPGAGG